LRGKVARGTALYHRESLRQLLSWPLAEKRPELAIVLVDADGEPHRRQLLDECTRDLPVHRVIAVAVQEFEAWMVADQSAAAAVLGADLLSTGDPERMDRREAKDLLSCWIQTHKPEARDRDVRMTLARTCRLETLAKRCPAFAGLCKDLAAP
jgi:hypothetical protein